MTIQNRKIRIHNSWQGLVSCLLICILFGGAIPKEVNEFPVPAIPFDPPHYLCYQTSGAINIDGRLDESSWQNAQWSRNFVNIRGGDHPGPPQPVRMKILWDEEYLYFAAEIIEEDIWAQFTERESPLYQENCFEIFLEPDGDTQNYYEFQINALNTTWDLLLFKPYRDGGPGLTSWDMPTLKTAVMVDGTLNDPSDKDKKWQVEIAMPWENLMECAPGDEHPENGAHWRANFSRVNHPLTVENGAYTKKINPDTGNPYQSNFFTWAPQGLRQMHYPEMYGFLQFSTQQVGSGTAKFTPDPNQDTKWLLRRLYYAQNNYFEKNGHYAEELSSLNPDDTNISQTPVKLSNTFTGYQISAKDEDTGDIWNISEDGHVWLHDNAQDFEQW